MHLSEADFVRLIRLSLVASIFPENDLISFFMTKIKSHCVSIPHFLHPHLCCRTPRLIPLLSYREYCFDLAVKYTCVMLWLRVLQVNTQKG